MFSKRRKESVELRQYTVHEKFLEFEKTITETLSLEDSSLTEIFKKQLESSVIKNRDFTGVGIFTYFEIADKELRLPNIKGPFGSLMAEVNGILVDILLWIKDGLIDCLELVTFGDDKFPEIIEPSKIV